MSTSSIYRDFLVNDVIKSFLVQGITPTEAVVNERVAEITENNPNLDKPFFSRDIYYTDEYEESSAEKINEIKRVLISDLTVAYSSLNQQAIDITNTYDIVSSELKLIEKKVKILEGKISNLLLLSKNTDGYLDYVSDNFANTDKTDMVNTTCFVDNSVGAVTLPLLENTRVPLSLSDSDIQFNVITRKQLQSVTLLPGSKKINAFNDEESIWAQRIAMSRGVGSVSAELIFRIPNLNDAISKIVLKPIASGTGNVTTATIQYSNDGINWLNINENNTKKMTDTTAFFVEEIQASYWKIIFNKAGYDEFINSLYFYEFGLKSVQMYSVNYRQKQNKLTGTLYSKVLQSEERPDFNRVSLKVCEETHENTFINYSLAALTEQNITDYNQGLISINDLNFIKIDPIDREEKIYDSVIDFALVDNYTGINSDYQTDSNILFFSKTTYTNAIDYIVDQTLPKENIRVLRNTGENELNGGFNTPVLVDGISSGWLFDGQKYYCEFYISEDSGRYIDFGRSEVKINNRRVSGNTFLAKGFYKFSTDKANWRTVYPADMISTENPDTLYPYNHKYLIEGIGDFLYGADMSDQISGISKKEIVDPDNIYSQGIRYWAATINKVDDIVFFSSTSNSELSVYTYVKDDSGVERIVIKNGSEPSLLDNEKIAIMTKVVNNELYKGLILKADFESDNSKVTPILDEYLIRLGY